MRTRIKICGITRPDDASYAAGLGVDAIGLVFVKKSVRHVTLEQAETLLNVLPPFVSTVGLFMDNTLIEIEEIVSHLSLSSLQFHGNEPVALCEAFDLPYIKAVPMGGGIDPLEYVQPYLSGASGFLLDSHASGGSGGSGDRFDWHRIPPNLQKPIILAGGLTVDNVGRAITMTQPYAVDVSSGVEVSQGIKDPTKIKNFIKQVNLIDKVTTDGS